MAFKLSRRSKVHAQSSKSNSTNATRRRRKFNHQSGSRRSHSTATGASGRWASSGPVKFAPRAKRPLQDDNEDHSEQQSDPRPESGIQSAGVRRSESDITDDTLNEILMAVVCTRNQSLGCAYYVASEERLYLMEDIQLGDVELVDTLKSYVSPTTTIVSVNTDDRIISLLGGGEDDQYSRESDDGVATSASVDHNLETVPPSAFKHDSGIQKLINLGLGFRDPNHLNFSVPGDVFTHENNHMNAEDSSTGRHAELLRLPGFVDLENHLAIGCCGAVLSYIARRRASRFLPNDENAEMLFRVSSIELFSMKETMFINRDALHSLQIFSSESHSNSHNQGPTGTASSRKEGFSLYGLFQNLARTPQGRLNLRRCFLRPSLSLGKINSRLDTISILISPENTAPFEEIVKALKNVIDARKSVLNLKKGISGDLKKPKNLGRTVWSGLREFAYQVICIDHAMDDIVGNDRLVLYDEMKTKFNVNDLACAAQMINEMIDFEETADPSRIIKSGIYECLDEKRRLYDGVDSLLSEVARDISMDVPEGLPANLNVVYFPQIGYLISMPKDPETNRSLWEGTDEDVWHIMFSSENSVYYKNDKMKQMDNYLGDIWNDICDKEIEILHDLSSKVLEFETAFVEASDLCGELDCLVALAAGAKKYGFCRPQITAENIIDISQGRHPLQELLVPSFVPNDTYLQGPSIDVPCRTESLAASDGISQSISGEPGPNILILTGPNFSGKSIYLKQVALIVYLVHIGSFVPAERARIGLTDKILTRITTRESVSACSSAFALDLQQMSLALKLATPRSLLIVDEFGKGTTVSDGAGLFAGVIKDLLGSEEDRANGNCRTPKVLAATHFHELFEMGILSSQPELHFGHMEIRIDDSLDNGGDTELAENNGHNVVYLYNYRNGRSVRSYGICCAALNGIEPKIVRRAEHLAKLAARGENLVSACTIMSSEEMSGLQIAEKTARTFLESDLTGDPRQLLDQIVEASRP